MAPKTGHPKAKKRQKDAVDALLKRKAGDTAARVRREKRQSPESERNRFLMDANNLLSASLEYETTLRSIANLVVPKLAEWCTVHVQEEDGSIQQLAIAHADPAMIEYSKELNRKYPPDNKNLLEQLSSGKTQFYPEITDAMLVQGARDEEHLRIMRSLKLSSYMGVPLIARGRALGVIGFFASNGKHYTQDDLLFAQTLAGRAALAIDNARLYRKAQQASAQLRLLNSALEQKVEERTKELQASRAKDRVNLQRMRFMIHNLPLAAMAIDEKDIILEVNDLFCRTLGLHSRPDQMIGRPRQEFVAQWKDNVVDFDSRAREFDEAVRTLQPLIGQEKHMKDGRILLRDLIPIQDDGAYHGALILYRDVSQERRIDATKSEFMSLASHQLRTPLTAIRWIFGRLAKNLASKVGPLEQHLLEDGRQAAARMSDTINTMLQISRLQSGQLKPDLQDVRLIDFLGDVVQSYQAQSEAKQQAISIHCAKDLHLVSDPQLLREVICNLLGNAIKYTPEKGTISLSAEKHSHTLEVTVKDSGYGIPKHQHAKVFHKFFRGDNIVSKDPDGTGLGLHMVSLITELLGGSIAFESAEGRGTAFTLAFPV